MDDKHVLESLLAIFNFFFPELCSVCTPLLNQMVCFLDAQLLEFFIYSRHRSFVRCTVGEDILLFSVL